MNKALLSLKEVSEYLGIGETKTREILRNRNCPFSMKIGYRWYANRKLLDQWLQEQTEHKGGSFTG
ncbi:excisionase [Anaerostipes caccae]|uniref:excisionase n=1 Tax=Anaerostipes caccae TaxID=105841 RepID=UPI00241E986D|nr:excisionase [Anaerostipes caccae]